MNEDAGIGAVGRAKRSLDAIRVLHRMRSEGRTTPTDGPGEERETLLGFSGWGPLTNAFAPDTATWGGIYEELTRLLPEPDLEIGRRSTYTAFYTPPKVVRSMWKLLTGLGFDGGNVLEAGCGRGNFMDWAPELPMTITGVDRDPTAAAIAQLLYPNARIITSPFEKAKLPGGYAAAIGNVPFGDVSINDPLAPERVKENLHNYFIWRALSELAPGGVAALITSRYTMDATNEDAREEIAELANFVGAIRLPNGGLGGGTDIIADILVFRRRAEGKVKASANDRWLSTETRDNIHVNSYWFNRPEMVLGTMRRGGTNQWGLTLAVDPIPDLDLGWQLAGANSQIVGRATERGLLWVPPRRVGPLTVDDIPTTGVAAEKGWEEGTYHVHQGAVVKIENGGLKRISNPSRELRALMSLRDLAQSLYALEANHDLPNDKIEPVRVTAREKYLAYVAKYGAINRCTITEETPAQREKRKRGKKTPIGEDDLLAEVIAEIGDDALRTFPGDEDFGLDDDEDEEPRYRVVRPSMGGFASSPDFVDVAALEKYDEDTEEHEPAAILFKRQNRRVERPTVTDDPATALAWSLDRLGGQVDLDYIARALGRPAEEIPGLLGDRLYHDPGKRRWVLAEEYLSGDVRVKLSTAKRAAAEDEQFNRNVAALEAVQPRWLEPHEITVNLGAPWIELRYVEQFIKELLRVGATVRRIPSKNAWEITGGHRSSPEATAMWGTTDFDAYELIEHALNNQIPVVRDVVKLPDGTKVYRKDIDRSMAAVQKREEIIAWYGDWIWEDPHRAEALCYLYNHRFNAEVARHYDGSHITIEGMSPGFIPYAHQLSYVARAVDTRAGLCAFPVGGGKTPTMGMVALYLKRLGLIKKPMISVPTHLLDQTVRLLRQLLPGAKILAASSQQVNAKNRRSFAAKCATGDWDMVICSHTALEALKVSEVTEARYLMDQEASLSAAIREACPDGVLTKGMVKRVAKSLDRLDEKIDGLRTFKVKRDDGVTFEMLGIDYLMVDEAHAFKNLALPCRTEGFSVKPSKRATDMDMRLAYLERTYPGRPYATLLTGTPISNTMMEIYVVLHYLMPGYLDSIELGSADSFASTFVQFTTKVEVTVDGGGFQMRTRPAVFVNAPELRMLLAMVSDIRTKEQLGLERRQIIDDVEVCPPTALQAEYSVNLVARAEKARQGGRRKAKGADNMLNVCTDGRRMATDPWLVGIRDDEPGKLDRAAKRVIKLWREYPNELQFVFCDVGTPNADKGDQTYGRIRDKLVALGMPRKLIAFVHDARNDTEKAALMARCRKDGGLAVIIGSSEKLGTGVNAQNRAIAAHDVDAPMVPAMLEQRFGRVDRKGNRNMTVYRIRYVTERTFDAYLWQMLHRKASFISQILTGENLGRTIEDVQSDQVMSMAAIKASATGQQILLEKADLEGKLKVLLGERRQHLLGLQQMKRRKGEIPMEIRKAERALAAQKVIAKTYTGEFPEDAAERLGTMTERRYRYDVAHLAGLKVHVESWRDVGDIACPLLVVETPDGNVEKTMRLYHKGKHLLEALIGIGDNADAEVDRLTAKIEQLRADLVSATVAAERPFVKDDVVNEIKARLHEIEAEITAAALKSNQDERVPDDVTDPDPDRPAEVVATPATQPTAELSDLDRVDLDLMGLDVDLSSLFEDVPEPTPELTPQVDDFDLDIDLASLVADELAELERLEAAVFDGLFA